MKTQVNKRPEFKKGTVIELNDKKMQTINGGDDTYGGEQTSVVQRPTKWVCIAVENRL